MTGTSPRILTIPTRAGRPPWHVEWHASLGSTMDRARELAQARRHRNAVVVADYQSRGRGTRGRAWIAPSGTCLMFSFVMESSIGVAELSRLPVKVAKLMCAVLNDAYGLDIAIDPPNDLTLHGRKVAGVLCQSHLRSNVVEWVICGIGLNTNLPAETISVPDSTSLLIETGHQICHTSLLKLLLGSLDSLIA